MQFNMLIRGRSFVGLSTAATLSLVGYALVGSPVVASPPSKERQVLAPELPSQFRYAIGDQLRITFSSSLGPFAQAARRLAHSSNAPSSPGNMSFKPAAT